MFKINFCYFIIFFHLCLIYGFVGLSLNINKNNIPIPKIDNIPIIGIRIGDSIQNQLQVITPINLRIIKITNSILKKLPPPVVALVIFFYFYKYNNKEFNLN